MIPLRISTPKQRAIRICFLIALLLFGVCLLPSQVRADGKGFSKLSEDSVQTADQSAAIVWQDGLERLVIETKLETENDSVAWVVPLPSTPDVERATRGTFPTLRRWFAPNLNDEVGLPNVVFVCTLIVLLTIVVAGLLARKIGLLTFIISVPLLALLAAWLSLSLWLPGLGRPSSKSTASGIQITAEQTVGNYKVTTVQGDSTDALVGWLKDNGYALPEGARPVIADYVARDWVFTAAKLERQESKASYVAPHPLELTFASERCVYPMALTGVAQESPIRLELFVFADRQARVSPLDAQSVLRAKRPSLEDEPGFRAFPQFGSEFTMRHPYLTELVGLKPGEERVATHLAGTVTPGQMREDLLARFSSPVFYRAQRYTSAAILERACWAAAAIFAVGAVVIGVVSRAREDSNLLERTRPILYLLLIVAIGTGGVYGYYWKKQGKAAPMKPGATRAVHLTVSNIFKKAEKETESGQLGSDWARKTLEQRFANALEDRSDAIPTPQEVDAPLNYTIQVTTNGVAQVFTYGHDGVRHLAWKHESAKGRSGQEE